MVFWYNAVDPFFPSRETSKLLAKDGAQRRMGSGMIGMRTNRACVNPSFLVVVTGKGKIFRWERGDEIVDFARACQQLSSDQNPGNLLYIGDYWDVHGT